MAKLSLEELRKFRDSESLRLRRRSIHGRNVHVVVCMGTCGIAAGAKIVLNPIVDELEARALTTSSSPRPGVRVTARMNPSWRRIAPGSVQWHTEGWIRRPLRESLMSTSSAAASLLTTE